MKKTHLAASALVAALFAAAPLLAQGNPTGTSSDVTGPPTTSSEIAGGFAPGTAATLATPAVQAAVVSASATVTAALSTGTLTTPSGIALPAPAQAQVLAVLTTNAPTTGAAAQLAAVLGSSGASAAVQSLVASLSGLASNPAQLPAAIGNYNALVQAVTPAFLANPPAQFLAVQAVLAQLTAAAGGAK